MTLVVPGYWHSTYWPEDHWHQDYWQEYGLVTETPSRIFIARKKTVRFIAKSKTVRFTTREQ